jgi:four helix bundle protein
LRTFEQRSLDSGPFFSGLMNAGLGMEVSMVQSFRDLQVWKKGMDLADSVYTATARFPREEVFGLAAQLRRAAVSIPSNIAEGRAVGGGRFLHHIRMAIGSEAEVETQIELAVRRSYISPAAGQTILNDAAEVRRMLHGLHRTLKARRLQVVGITVIAFLSYSAALIT